MTITKHLYSEGNSTEDICQVMIKIQHHGNEKWIPTSVTCRREHWNSLECHISDKDDLHRIKNEAIEAQFRRVAGKIQDQLDDYLSKNLDAICSHLVENHSDYSINESSIESDHISLINLIEDKIDTITTLNTRRGYKSLLNYFYSNYGKGPDIKDVDRNFMIKFDSKLKIDFQDQQPTRHLMLARMRAVLNHARDNGTLPLSVAFKLPKVPLRPRDRNLSEMTIKRIFKLYKNSFFNDSTFKYPNTFALSLFILDIAFQGLAPVDLASLKINQIKLTTLYPPDSKLKRMPNTIKTNDPDTNTINPIEVIIIRTSRQKTGQQVTIVASLKPLRPIIDNLMKGKQPDDYLIPCFNAKKVYTPEQRQDRLANYFYKMSCHLNNALKTAHIDRDEMGYQRRVTFYYARHAFCNLIDSLDVPRHLIQHMIGHRTTVLETNYLRRITPWEQAQLSYAILSPLLD